jgi:hypothetical protein
MRGVHAADAVIRTAAMHNLREFVAATGAPAHIDPSKTCRNYLLRGPGCAAEVDALAIALRHDAGVNKYRKDATMAVEVLVSLPYQSGVHEDVYFSQAVAWAETYFQAPVLSAVVHLDEAAPHCHILILPLIAGRLNGGRLAGGPAKLRAMHEDFYQAVGRHFGLKRPTQKKRMSRAEQYQRGSLILGVLADQPGRMAQPPVRAALIEIFGQNSDLLFEVLGVQNMPVFARTEHKKTFVEIMTAPQKRQSL